MAKASFAVAIGASTLLVGCTLPAGRDDLVERVMALDCAKEPYLLSERSADATAVAFRNRTDESVQVYRIAFAGERQLYRVLAHRGS